jgi:hypothetical protein
MPRTGTIGAMGSLVALLLISGAAGSRSGPQCLQYEPKIVQVSGRLAQRTFPGPPNYESIEAGDARDVQLLLRLRAPVSVSGTAGDTFNVEASGIQEMQLVIMKQASSKRYASLAGKDVRVTGSLFHTHTGHSRTPVLITVRSVQLVPGRPGK